ncbi:uncharacterized protein [Porites lutea]|uniref:uncharacterized protein n=1 Tax=Porites lutea TaxID=51062 RepID=UPI003CC52AF8
MAWAEYDEKTQEQSLQFESLGEQGNDARKWREHTQTVLFYFLKQLSKLLEKRSENGILFRPYGSAAEDLKCIEPDDVGDVDIVIYPDSDNLMIHEEFIEYLPENPMHVRIKGADHPVLKSCLVEDKEYVATSALKKFHPAIYGRSAPYIVDITTRAHQQIMLTPERSSLLQSTSYLKDKEASPAITVNFTRSLNKQPSDASPHVDTEEWEWLVHVFCNLTGTVYTKEHAKIIDDITQFMNEVGMYLDNKRLNTVSEMLPVFIEFYQSDRAKTLQARFQSISKNQPHDYETRRKKNMEFRKIGEKQHVLSGEQQRKENNANLFQRTCSSCELPCVKTEHCKGSQTNATEFHSDMRNHSGNSDCDAIDERSETKRSGDFVENHISSEKEQLLTMQKYQSPSQGEAETREKRMLNLFFDHVFGSITELGEHSIKEAANVTDFEKCSDQQEGGFDFVPAFKAPGWPMVAQEWIRRERKWPSQEVIDQILQEGFHLVVKAPKNGGNLECDFRISFANAEYLLSRELNEVQRECYRCLRKFHRAYLSTKPKSLVSFHLKNLFLQTVEETGAEIWTQSNRVECMMKLFRNLLGALRKKDLRHFFVRSYNLFSIDYIADPNILEPLVGICEKINENPMQFVRKLTQRQNSEQTKKEQNCMPALTTQGQSDVHQEVSWKGTKKECKEAINQESSAITSFRYHDLKDIFLSTSKEMTDLAFNNPNCSLQSLHSLEKSIIEDLREIEKYHIIQIADFPKMFDMCWDTAYFKILISQEPNIRSRILDGIKSVLEWCKYVLKQDDFAPGNEEAIIQRMLDPSSKDSFDLNHILPAGLGSQFIRKLFGGEQVRPAQAPKVIQDDILLD